MNKDLIQSQRTVFVNESKCNVVVVLKISVLIDLETPVVSVVTSVV